ncbi:MAG: hypothetical protein ACYCWW_15205 [Deltaproteobacteria bacterium]
MAGNAQNPKGFLGKVDALEAGTKKNIVGKATVTVQSNPMTSAQLQAKLGTADALYGAVTSARAALKQALTSWETALPDLRQFVKDYELAIKGLLGSKSPLLVDFGMKPAKPAVRTAETTAKGVAQGRQTRLVRGTKGKKQRQQITTSGEPGLLFVTPSGQPIPGALAGPRAPVSVSPDAGASGGSSSGGSSPSGTSASSSAPASGNGSGSGK